MPGRPGGSVKFLSQDDLRIRHRLEEELESDFTASGIGVVDGDDIGSGTMNVFGLVQLGRWNEAMAAACSVLELRPADSWRPVAVSRTSFRPGPEPAKRHLFYPDVATLIPLGNALIQRRPTQ